MYRQCQGVTFLSRDNHECDKARHPWAGIRYEVVNLKASLQIEELINESRQV